MAAEMVWDTACPHLLFPCLFEEMAANILNRYVLDEPIDDAAPASPEENDPAFGDIDTTNGRSRPISEDELIQMKNTALQRYRCRLGAVTRI